VSGPHPIRVATPPEDERIAEKVAQMIVRALLDGRPYEKQRRTLARLMDVAGRFESASMTYPNVYRIRGGVSLEQDADRSETAEAARILAGVAAQAMDNALTAWRPERKEQEHR
jgi:hypothetical protein